MNVGDWGVRHADGKVTVHITGHAFPSRVRAEQEMAGFEDDCEWCDGGHEIVRREVGPWKTLTGGEG